MSTVNPAAYDATVANDKDLSWVSIALIFSIPLSTTLTAGLSVMYLVLIAFSKQYKESFRTLKSPIVLSVMLFVGLNFLSMFYTEAPSADMWSTLKKLSRLLLLPILIPAFKEIEWKNRALYAFIWATIFSVVFVYVNKFIIYRGSCFDVTFFKDRIYTSSFTAFTIFLLSLYVIEGNIHKRLKRIFFCSILILLHYLFFVNTGRTGQILLLPLLAIALYKIPNKRTIKRILISLVLGALFIGAFCVTVEKKVILNHIETRILTFPTYFRFKESYFQTKNFLSKSMTHENRLSSAVTDFTRLEFYRNTAKLCLNKPWLGYGVGSFAHCYGMHYPERSTVDGVVKNPHNQYLLTTLELGFVGLCTLFSIFLSILFFAVPNVKRFDRKILLGLVASMLIGCMANSWMLDVTSCYFFIAMLAIIGAQHIKTTPLKPLI